MPRSHSEPVNRQPIGEIPLIASMIDGALDDTGSRPRSGHFPCRRGRPAIGDNPTDAAERQLRRREKLAKEKAAILRVLIRRGVSENLEGGDG